jgi:integrase
MRYLSDEEARRLVNASSPDFRTLVTAALLTGCRYGELIRLTSEDFDPAAGTLRIRESKSGRPRHVALTDEGRRFLERLVAGIPPRSLILAKGNGRAWQKSEQQRPLERACRAGRLEPITFHGLRHTYASRLAMRGVPLAVIAAQLGHSDTRMVEKHYGHLAPNYVAETVRAAFGSLALVDDDNVERPVQPDRKGTLFGNARRREQASG